jgi:tetratricopeptide (TPR) repeat protein
VIGIVQSGAQSRADRFTYFPAMGLWMAVVWVWPAEWLRERKWRIVAGTAGAAAVGIFAVYTTLRIALWWDPLALYIDGAEHTHRNWFLECQAGIDLQNHGHLEGAAKYYRLALEHSTVFDQAHYNLGAVLYMQGNKEEALKEFQQALELKPERQDYQERVKMVKRELAKGFAIESAPAAASQP